MKKIVLTLMAAWLSVAVAFAADPSFRDDVPERYTVKEGDTLWGISAMFLQDPWLWPEIWQANPQIPNPHLIYPGDVIAMVYIDGKPRLTIERGATSGGSAAMGASRAAPRSTDGRTVVLTPTIKKVPNDRAIPALPLEAINNFLIRIRLVREGELEAAPYVVAGHEKKLIGGSGDDFYVRGTLLPGVDFYGIYRQGDPYIDKDTEELLGLKAEDIGSAQVKKVEGQVATVAATRSVREIRIGDRLLPHEERRLDSSFFPVAPDTDIKGKIISVEGGVTQVGYLDVVAINRGERDGLKVGNLLGIFKAGEQVQDRVAGDVITLPSERAGMLMVFRSYEKMSFGLVLHADRPLAVDDEVANP